MQVPFELPLLMLAASVLAVAGLRLLNLPAMLAYLLVGIVAGPLIGWTMGGSAGVAEGAFGKMGEIGIVFLMFSLGLEFNLAKLHAMRRHVFGLGGLQVGVAIAVAMALPWLLPVAVHHWLFGDFLDWKAFLVLGGAFAMSSTAMVGKLLAERREIETEHGRRVFGVLLFQDLAVIPLLVLIPALARAGDEGLAVPLLWAAAKACVVLVLLLRLGQPVMRGWFHMVARRRSHELFTLNVLLVTLLGAWLTKLAGLSLEMGAFVAGMLISETEYRMQVEEDIKPFRDVLLGLFFITLGMRLDAGVVVASWQVVLVLTVLPILFKFVLVTLAARGLGAPTGTALRTGLWLAQAGEFGFVLMTLGGGQGLLDEAAMQPVLAAMLLSMLLSPLILARADRLVMRLSSQEWMQRSLQLQRIASRSIARDRHVLLCGYGRAGQSVAHVLEAERIPFVALDLDPDRVREASAAGETVVYGDATRRESLVAAGVHRASALVVSFADTQASLKLLAQVRELAPKLPVLVRAQDDRDIERLRAAGATEVVPEIIEGSLMLASHALALAGVSLPRVLRRVRQVRDDQYTLLRGFFHGADDGESDGVDGDHVRLRTITLDAGAPAVGGTLAVLGLPVEPPAATTEGSPPLRVSALVRGGRRMLDPAPDTVLHAGDTLVLSGTTEALGIAEERLQRIG